MNAFKPLTALFGALLVSFATGCASTQYTSTTTTYNPDGSKTVESWGANLTGNYGIIAKKHQRGNQGNGGNGQGEKKGWLDSIMFSYNDSMNTEFEQATGIPTTLAFNKDGFVITGPVDHSTRADIIGNNVNRGIRNVATYLAAWKLIDGAQSAMAAREVTKRLGSKDATSVKLNELFTQKELAAIDSQTTLGLAEIDAAASVAP
jgi:hypothetical protein